MRKLILGDCLAEMAKLEACSVDSIVTDPPYHLTTGKKGGSGEASVNLESPYGRARVTTGFMGKAWDGGDIAHDPATWIAALRIAKPGAYLLAFGGTRTFHRLAVAIEDAGWEIRDTIMWVYGSGFPKSHDVSKAIDREAGVEREVVGVSTNGSGAQPHKLNDHGDGDTGIGYMDGSGKVFNVTAPSTELAKVWEGWGTALKPAWEPIIVARKPLEDGMTVAENVKKWGTGAMNIDGCRVNFESDSDKASAKPQGTATTKENGAAAATPDAGRNLKRIEFPIKQSDLGRWPANLIHDGSQQVLDLFPDSRGQIAAVHRDSGNGEKTNEIFGKFATHSESEPRHDTGSAARFFYCTKATKADRDEGMQESPDRMLAMSNQAQAELRRGNSHDGAQLGVNNIKTRKNNHPTVKPTTLMRYLCKLVTQPGGTVCDPFMGSGSTGKAARIEGFGFVGIEKDADHFKIAEARA